MRIDFEIWNNAEIPNFSYIFFNSVVNFLVASKSEEEQMRFFFVLRKLLSSKISCVMEVIFRVNKSWER